VDGLMGGPILFDAVRVDGLFASVTTWGVPRQGKPFAPLAEVATTRPVLHLEEVSGTMAGFHFPDFARGLNVPGPTS
jgi:acetolactate decarboxylase